MIVRLIPIAAAQVSATTTDNIDGAFPAVNLVDAQPKTVCQSVASANTQRKFFRIRVDLGANTPVDTVAVLFMNFCRAPTMEVYAAPAVGGNFDDQPGNLVFTGTVAAARTSLTLSNHGLATFSSVSRRYVSIYFNDDRVAGEVIGAGVVCLGQSLTPAHNFELGSGRKVEDQSISRILPGGETATERGGTTPLWRGTWSNLTEAELNFVWSLLLEVGTGAPVLVIEDPDRTTGQRERIHYGQLTGLDFTERQQLDKQRIDIVVRELV